MWTRAAKWWCNQGPPVFIFREAQAARWLLAPLFSIDSFLQNPLSNDREFCRKLSHESVGFCKKRCFLSESGKSGKFFYTFVGKWPRCRGPPFWKSESYPSALIFRFSEVALCTTENIFGFFSETFLTRSKTARVILYHYSRA